MRSLLRHIRAVATALPLVTVLPVEIARGAPLPSAPALPFGPGERVEWDVHYAGVRAGTAFTEVVQGAEGSLTLRSGCRNAPWYERIYKIDDEVVSTWDPRAPGSRSYVTRFREGTFHQDQAMDLDPAAIRVQRSQRFKEGWRTWSDVYEGPGTPVEDPQSAFYRIRTLPLETGTVYTVRVFSGRKTWNMGVKAGPRQDLATTLGTFRVVPVHVQTRHEGDWEQKGGVTVYLTDDSRRVPVRMEADANVGSITVTLSRYQPPTSTPGAGGGEPPNPGPETP